MLKQNLQQKLLQKLSPQQIQLIKLLELPTIQLEQRIKKELEENPTLEEGRANEDDEKQEDTAQEDYDDEYTDEFSVDDYINEGDLPNYKLQANNYSKDDKITDIPYSVGISLQQHLENQVGLQKLDERQRMLAKYIIGNIDDAGYLRREIESIADDLVLNANISVKDEELYELLKIIQKFDPPGVGASNLQESLLLQIKRKIKENPQDRETLELTAKILEHYFDEFSKKHYSKILQRLSIDESELKKAVDVIMKLSPKPGAVFSNAVNRSSQHITPDFILEIDDNDNISVHLNSGMVPDLRVSRTYADMLQNYQDKKEKPSRKEKNTITFVKQKLDSAKWFIDAIKQRQNTLLTTMQSIVDYQKEYFKTGDETKLRPMILKDIADRTQLDISTISRVANSKYIQTHFGIFPLKYFFSEGMETQDGETVSTREIKRILQECIDNESKKKPLTDEKLAQILQEKGYKIARRTVAKYREQLGILVARLRKKL